FDLERYQEVIQKEYGNLNLESLDTSAYLDNDLNLLKLWPMFIPQNVRNSQEYLPQVHEIPKGYLKEFKDSEQLEEKFNQEKLESLRRTYFQQQTCSVLELVENQNSQYLVILGDPGSGKSTLLQYIALKWAKLLPKDLPSYPIPLLIELKTYIRNYNDHNYTNFLEFLEKSSGVICNFPQHELDGQLKNGNGIVMFDGLDEVFDHTQREEVITNIKKFASIYKKVKIIVTSRVIGYEAKTFKNANFSHYMLEDLDEKQIEDFIQRWHQFAYEKPEDRQWRKERLLKAIKSSSAIQQIAGNPLLLTMMAIMNRNLELAKNKSDLYSKASEFLLNWNVELAHSK
ncbi:MAG: NACHT domain-containing protein, partial [Trichodesmium sp. St18_bin1]|nr:NACHT domain-containing protein [Trichodesmium sp. St18_bin1]